jgi:hypothetical protein
MSEPRLADIGLVATSDPFGWVIREGTESEINHIVRKSHCDTLLEATTHGVVESPISKYERIGWLSIGDVSDEEREATDAYARTFLGIRYSFVNIFVLALRRLHAKFLADSPALRWLATKEGLICSEYANLVDRHFGRALVDKPDYQVEPVDFARIKIYQ